MVFSWSLQCHLCFYFILSLTFSHVLHALQIEPPGRVVVLYLANNRLDALWRENYPSFSKSTRKEDGVRKRFLPFCACSSCVTFSSFSPSPLLVADDNRFAVARVGYNLSALLLFSRWLVCSVAQLEKDSTIKQPLSFFHVG
jgi:hypothetical protein